MNKPELYTRTVDILVQAYFNDTLQHRNCYACAVGNLVAGNMGLGFEKCTDDSIPVNIIWASGALIKPYWDEVFCTLRGIRQSVFPEEYLGEAKRQRFNRLQLARLG